MKIFAAAFAFVGLTAAGQLDAQVRPQLGPGDPRIQSIDYRADQVVLIEAAPGYQVRIELASDENIESAAVGDSGAWQVTANRALNRLFVKPLQAGADTNMTIVTNVRLYAFDLSALSAPSRTAPYTVRFHYALPPAGLPGPSPQQSTPTSGRYKLSGARALRPTSVHDDGTHTYVEWPADVGLPATYVIDENGREMLANGNMRDGIYVLDTVAVHLEFRIDKRVARADRLRSRRGSL